MRPFLSLALVRWAGAALIAIAASTTTGCINFNLAVDKGTQTGELTLAINEGTAPYVVLDLVSGERTTALTIADLTSAAAYVGNKMVFRRVVGLGDDYLMGVFEVTQAQWQAIAPAVSQPWTLVDTAVVGSSAVSGSLPAFNLSNDDIVAGLAAYNAGKTVQLQLPSDAQWAFACSAGSTGAWSWGAAADRATLASAALVAETRSGLGPQTVGGLAPNSWGFYDMHGNVWEWTGNGTGAHLRGGSWHDAAVLARTTNLIATGQGVYSDTHHALAGVRLILQP